MTYLPPTRRLPIFCRVILLAVPISLLAIAISAQDAGVGKGRKEAAQAGSEERIRALEKTVEELRKLVELQTQRLADQHREVESVEWHLTFAPDDVGANEDYRQARTRFRTKLIKKG